MRRTGYVRTGLTESVQPEARPTTDVFGCPLLLPVRTEPANPSMVCGGL